MNLKSVLPPIRTQAVVVGALAAAGLSLAATSPAVAAKAAHRTAPKKPTIVLVHGAFADSSSWNGVIKRLQHDGYPVIAPANPLRGVASDAAYIHSLLKSVHGPIVLVGHSYGGSVISEAAAGDPQVKALVYIDAFAPAQGETLNDLININGPIDPTTLFDFVPYAGGPSGDVDLYLKGSVFSTVFANGLPKPEQDRLYAAQRPLTASALDEKSGAPAWATIPSWYVVGTNDHVIPAALQEYMAKRAGSHVTTVNAGHLSFIARPDVVVNTILQAARATR